MPGAGASSITFWWRRWSEQSRSNRWTTLPWLSPNTCTSMWRGERMYFSISTRSSPNELAASRLQLSSASSKSLRGIDPAHALAAAARDRLDQHRIADRVGFLLEPLRVLVLAEIAGRHRHAGVGHQLLGRVLQAHGADAVRLRPDPDQARVDHRLGEVGILARGSRSRGGSPCALVALAAAMIFSPTQIALARRATARCAPPRPPCARAAPWRRRPNRPRPCGSPSPARCG